jgi:hypothetical protein
MSARDLPLYLATGVVTTTLGADCASAWINVNVGQPVSFQMTVAAGAYGAFTVEGTNSEEPAVTVIPSTSYWVPVDAINGAAIVTAMALSAPFAKVRLKYTRASGGSASTCYARYSLGARGIVTMTQEFPMTPYPGASTLATLAAQSATLLGLTNVSAELLRVAALEGRLSTLAINIRTPEEFGGKHFTNSSDAATADDATEAIQDACDDLDGIGGKVLCFGGGYRVDRLLDPPDGVEIVGLYGMGNVGGGLDPAVASPMPVVGTVFYKQVYSDFSFITAGNGCAIRNIAFDSVDAAPTITGGTIAKFDNTKGSGMYDCFVHQAYHGVSIANTVYGQGTVNTFRLDRVDMTNVKGNRFTAQDTCGVWVTDCAWFNAAVYSTSNGIRLTGGCASMFFSNVSIYKAMWSVDMECLSGAVQLNSIHFSLCEFDVAGSGILGGNVRANGWVTNVNFDGCWLGTGTQGTRIFGASGYSIGGIKFTNCTLLNHSYAGAVVVSQYIDGVSFVNCSVNANNTANSDGYGAIQVERGANLRVLGCDLSNTCSFGGSGHQRFGVQLQYAEFDYVVVEGNIVSRGNTVGIVNNATGAHILADPARNV